MKQKNKKLIMKSPSKRDWKRLDMVNRIQDVEAQSLYHEQGSYLQGGFDYDRVSRDLASQYDKAHNSLRDFDKKYGYSGEKLKSWNKRMYEADGYFTPKKSKK